MSAPARPACNGSPVADSPVESSDFALAIARRIDAMGHRGFPVEISLTQPRNQKYEENLVFNSGSCGINGSVDHTRAGPGQGGSEALHRRIRERYGARVAHPLPGGRKVCDALASRFGGSVPGGSKGEDDSSRWQE